MSTPSSRGSASPRIGVSLFSGTGIGDLGWVAQGVMPIALCEVDPPRAAVAAHNFPEARVFADPIETIEDEYVDFMRERTGGGEIWVAVCTPPCQGMSKSGQGTLLSNIRAGKRPHLDPRNRLIIPALRILKRLQPRWIVFENVVEMKDTIIQTDEGEFVRIVDLIASELGGGYVGAYYAVEFADYGIPQRRQRLISVLTRDPIARDALDAGESFIPSPTHARAPTGSRMAWVSVTEALSAFPALDAGTLETATSDVPFHRVPVLDERKYWWVSQTPENASAFDNQCVNPACRCTENPTHGTGRDAAGINRTRRDTPVYCMECGDLLPRPAVENEDGTLRLMRGYTSAYKRMSPNLPASALTRNLSYPCSDNKIHPTQNRVLSLAEAFVIQTVAQFPYEWRQARVSTPSGSFVPPKRGVPDGLVRLALGESVPPAFFKTLAAHLDALSAGARGTDGPLGTRFDSRRLVEARGSGSDDETLPGFRQLSLVEAS